jgi:hypothetical protein
MHITHSESSFQLSSHTPPKSFHSLCPDRGMHGLVCGAWASQPCLLCESHANNFILGATNKGIITTDNNLSLFPVKELPCYHIMKNNYSQYTTHLAFTFNCTIKILLALTYITFL